jgi:hypothetical protein
MRAYVLFVWVLFSVSAFGETGGAEREVLRAAIIYHQMLLCTVLYCPESNHNGALTEQILNN